MTSETLIRQADVVVTMDGTRRELAGADVLLRGGVIAAGGLRVDRGGQAGGCGDLGHERR